MTTSKIIKTVNEIRLFGAGYVAHFDKEDVIAVLKAADDLYYNDQESFLTDSEYDEIRKAAERHSPNHPYFLGVGSAVRGGKVKLPYPMGSLTQAYEGDMERWIEKNNLQDEWFIVSDKIDGVSAMLVYGADGKLQIAYSRGDGVEGADITRHIRKIKAIPQSVLVSNVVVRGEIVIKKADFDAVKDKVKSRSGQPYKNARNMTAGVMNAEKNPAIVYDHLSFVAYEVLPNNNLDKMEQLNLLKVIHKFETPECWAFRGQALTTPFLTATLDSRRLDTPYEIDGLVVDVNDIAQRNRMVPTKDTLNPEFARKFKVADASNLAIATVMEVEWNVSKDGYLKPRVKIEPVELVGVTVQHATGFNAKFILDNEIGPGAKIKITRSGDVIPTILEVVEPMPMLKKSKATPHVIDNYADWFASELNDLGDWEWTPTKVDAILKNAHTHETVQFESLRDFFATLDVPALKEGNVKTLFDAGFTTPESIITMTDAELRSVIGKAIGQKIFEGLRAKLTNIPLYLLMGAHPAFGRGVGVRKMKKLYEAFEGYMERCQDIDAIVAVEGFDQKTAKKIVAGWPVFEEFCWNIRRHYSVAPWEAPKAGGLSGQVFVFTGFRSKELEEKVVEQGGKMGSAVSSKTTCLVAEDKDSNSGKAKKARELGIKVIGQDDLKKMLGM